MDKKPKIKTKSQTLRAVLYLLWEIEKKPGETAEVFYQKNMEAVIRYYRRRLPN